VSSSTSAPRRSVSPSTRGSTSSASVRPLSSSASLASSAAGGRVSDAWTCGVASWYRHASPPRVAYADAAGTPLGHPLGGYGHEHRVEARAWPADARWRLRAAFAAIEREPGNLLYERKPGAGWSAAFGAAYRLGARVELEAAGQVERGRTGWREHRASVRLAAFF
jgi:hypothetical protein